MGLAALRRFKNISRVEQSVFHVPSLVYVHAKPGEGLQGPGHRGIEHLSCFQETLEHLTYRDLQPLVAEEQDVPLLKRLLIVEAQTSKREAVAKIIAKRIKILSAGTGNNEPIANPDPRALPNAASHH